MPFRFDPCGAVSCFLTVLALGLGPPSAKADEGGHTLFSPTPAENMREFSPDRPNKTESPYTVDAGHFHLEMDFVTFTHDRVKTTAEDTVSKSYAIAPINFRMGITDKVEVQVIVDTFAHQRTTDYAAQSVNRISGFGDVTLRAKVNLWGDDGGATALGLLPFVKLPTAAPGIGNGKVEGGLSVPVVFALPGGFSLGAMTEVDINHDAGNSGYHPELLHSVTLGNDLSEKLGMYVEIFAARSLERGTRWNNTLDTGLTYTLAPNVKLDAGVNLGISQAADDINPFIGITFRW